MKKKIIISLFIAFLPALAYADLCTDLTRTYAERIQRLRMDTDAALAQTVDASEQQAIRASYDMQFSQLQMEMTASLTSAGCNPLPPVDPGTPPSDPGVPPSDPGTPPSDPGTPPSDPG